MAEGRLMAKRNDDKDKKFPLQCREGKGSEERCLLVGTYSPAMSGGPGWCPYHAAIHRDHWPKDKAAFFDWIELSRANGSLASSLPRFLAGEYTAEDVWEAICGRKALPSFERAPIDKGVRDRRLVELVVGGWAFPGAGDGLVQKILDGRVTVDVALAEIEKSAAKIAAETEAVGF